MRRRARFISRAWRRIRVGARLAARLLSLPLPELRRLIVAQWEILRVQWMARTRPSGALVAFAQLDARPGVDEPPPEVASDWARAVARAAQYGVVRPLCLVRSLALHSLLVRAGVQGSRVRVGVKCAGERFTAHAWVELNGAILADEPAYVKQYEPLADATIASAMAQERIGQ
jgi:hypothetical protein